MDLLPNFQKALLSQWITVSLNLFGWTGIVFHFWKQIYGGLGKYIFKSAGDFSIKNLLVFDYILCYFCGIKWSLR